MSWDAYIVSLVRDDVEEAAICGWKPGQESVWASRGCLSNITPDEIKKLMDLDRDKLFETGVSVAGMRCTIIRDALLEDDMYTLDLKTKGCPEDKTTYCISVSRSLTALIFVKGRKECHAGNLNTSCSRMAKYLKDLSM